MTLETTFSSMSKIDYMTLMSICTCVPFAEMDWSKLSGVKTILTNHVLIWNSIYKTNTCICGTEIWIKYLCKWSDDLRKDLPHTVGGRVPRLNLSNSIALIWYFPMYSANIGCAVLLIILQIACIPKRKCHWRIIQQEHNHTNIQMESLKYRV